MANYSAVSNRQCLD